MMRTTLAFPPFVVVVVVSWSGRYCMGLESGGATTMIGRRRFRAGSREQQPHFGGPSCAAARLQYYSRRDYLAATTVAVATAFLPPAAAKAASTNNNNDMDLVELYWNVKDIGGFPVAINGVSNENAAFVNALSSSSPSDAPPPPVPAVRIQYQTPNAIADCYQRVTVYQKTGTARMDTLQRAVDGTIPLARALDIGNRIGEGLKENLRHADLTRAQAIVRTNENDNNLYFEYDMVVPRNNDNSDAQKANYRYLFSATILNQRLYVFLLECDDQQWRRAASALLKARSSFRVQQN